MGGLAKLCKIYGSMTVQDANGNKVTWIWDYKNDKARLQSEMTKEEIAESEKEKWMGLKHELSEREKETESIRVKPSHL